MKKSTFNQLKEKVLKEELSWKKPFWKDEYDDEFEGNKFAPSKQQYLKNQENELRKLYKSFKNVEELVEEFEAQGQNLREIYEYLFKLL